METFEQLQARTLSIIERLKKEYPEAVCSLRYQKPHELLIATRLAAQCTDARVNLVTPALFARFPSIEAFAEADVSQVEELIKSCGLYHTKARDIVALCRDLRDRFGGVMPDTVEELTTLPGIGRKTANLMVGDVFGKPAVVCDTHCIRITNRLGMTVGKDAWQVEKQLWKLLPPEEANNFCHRTVLHGRAVCKAPRPLCEGCCLFDLCPKILGFGVDKGQKK